MMALAAALASAQGWRRAAAAALLGAAATAGLPPVNLTPLVVVAFTGLVWLLDGAGTWRRAGWTGWWFGFGYFTTGLYWIANALLIDPVRFGWLVPFAVFGLPAVLGLYTALAAIGARVLWTPGPGRVVALAVAWAGAEWLRGHWLTGFPWNLIGYTWSWSDAVLQSTSVIGIYGLGLATVFAAAAPAALVSAPAGEAAARLGAGRGVRWVPAMAAAVLLAGAWTAGAMRLAGAETASVPGVSLRLVQANIPQLLKSEADRRREILERHLALTGEPGAASATHVIWPESAVPYFLDSNADVRAQIAAALPPGGLLITGAIRARLVETPGGVTVGDLWNSVQALDGTGAVVASYDKSHLVPFGEYIPFRPVLAALGLEKIAPGSLDYSSGGGPRTLEIPGAPTVSALVCYEAIFPSAVVAPGARPGWLVNVTNDAWYGRSAGPYQHFAMVRTRAVELGLPLVRVANTGISGVADAYGRVTARLGLGETGVIDAPLPVAIAATLYATFGDLIFLILLMAGAAVAVGGKFRSI